MLTQSSMDIQVNQGRNVMFYLAKYMSKVDSKVIVEHNMQNTKDHLRARVIGAAKAAYFLCGWSKHRNSRRVILSTLAWKVMTLEDYFEQILHSYPAYLPSYFTIRI